MQQWDQGYIDQEKQGHFRILSDGMGGFVFGIVNGFIDCRSSHDIDAQRVEFSWDGRSVHDPVSGKGWFEMTAVGKIYEKLFIHNGVESWVKAVKR